MGESDHDGHRDNKSSRFYGSGTSLLDQIRPSFTSLLIAPLLVHSLNPRTSYPQESQMYTAFSLGGSSGHGDTRVQCSEVYHPQEACLPRASSHSSRAAINVLRVPMLNCILYTAISSIMSSGDKLCNATRQMPMTFIPDSSESITPELYLYSRSVLR